MEPFFYPSTRKKLPGVDDQPDRVQQSGYSQKALPFKGFGPYLGTMTKLLEKALEAVRRLPPDSQDHIALAMLSLSVNGGEPEKIDPADLPAVLEGLAQARRREFATDAEVEAAFRRFERKRLMRA
jgi:hypothetical protein